MLYFKFYFVFFYTFLYTCDLKLNEILYHNQWSLFFMLNNKSQYFSDVQLYKFKASEIYEVFTYLNQWCLYKPCMILIKVYSPWTLTCMRFNFYNLNAPPFLYPKLTIYCFSLHFCNFSTTIKATSGDQNSS